MIDFTDCRQLRKTYNGANGGKRCIEYKGDIYMLKFPSKPLRNTQLSYANGSVSEYICCHIYEMLGIPVQETLLGIYRTEKGEKLVVACKDFAMEPNTSFQDFGSLKNQVVDSIENGYGTELSDIMYSIDHQTLMEPKIIKDRFWDMFICDAFMANFDRHNGNWGFLYNKMTDDIKLSPVFDCGSCLYSQMDSETMQLVMNDKNEQNARIYNVPASAIKVNGNKLNYMKYLSETVDESCIEAIRRIYPLVDMEKIVNFINEIECITKTQKKFYSLMLQKRYDLILKPAYKRVEKIALENSQHIG